MGFETVQLSTAATDEDETRGGGGFPRAHAEVLTALPPAELENEAIASAQEVEGCHRKGPQQETSWKVLILTFCTFSLSPRGGLSLEAARKLPARHPPFAPSTGSVRETGGYPIRRLWMRTTWQNDRVGCPGLPRASWGKLQKTCGTNTNIVGQ